MSNWSTIRGNAENPEPARSRWKSEPEEPPPAHRSRLTLWLAILGLTALVIGGGWYEHVRLDEHGNALARMGTLPDELATLRSRVDMAEQQAAAIPGSIESLEKNLADLNKSLRQRLGEGLAEATKAASRLGVSIRKEIQEAVNGQQQAADVRLREFEAERSSEAERTRRLEQEVAQLNQRLGSVADEVQAVQRAGAREAGQIREELHGTDRRVKEVADFNNRDRERFEVGRGKTQEIAPGILLHVTNVDPRYRRFRGWIHLVKEGKILWLRDESVLQSVAFYAGGNTLRHDLVVTGLTPGGVSGYLIFPRRGELASPNSVSAGVASGRNEREFAR